VVTERWGLTTKEQHRQHKENPTMTTKVCEYHLCDQEFTSNRSMKKYCCNKHARAAANSRYFKTAKGKAALKKHQGPYMSRVYRDRVVPKGRRLRERLADMFQAQASRDPGGLPEMASRVLEWRPQGFSKVVQYALHPYGSLERDWLYYAEFSPEEAREVYARES
jgi:hypothetical protein